MTIDRLTDTEIGFHVGGLNAVATYLCDGDLLYFLHRGVTVTARDMTLAQPKTADADGGDGKVRAALNGRVVAVLAKPGDSVERGQPVVTLEAMKMEHVHMARVAGVIAAINVVEGEQVTAGTIVAEIEIAGACSRAGVGLRLSTPPGACRASAGRRRSTSMTMG